MRAWRCETAVFLVIAAGLLTVSNATSKDITGKNMSAKDIRHDIIGRTIFLAAPVTGEFPLNYRKNGVVDGEGAALGLGRFVKPNDTGKWWIEGNKLCQQFKTWYNGAKRCFSLVRLDTSSVKWILGNGDTGIARIGD